MPVRDVDVLGEAVAETEKELFNDAFGDTAVHDDSGNRDLEQLDSDLDDEAVGEADDGDKTEGEIDGEKPEIEAKEDATEGEKDPGAKPGEQTQEPQQGRVPSARLRETAERARAAEAERDALKAKAEELERNWRVESEMNRRAIEELRRAHLAQQQPRQQTQEPVPIPDQFAYPEQYNAWVQENTRQQIEAANRAIEQRFEQQRDAITEMNFQFTHKQHGEAFLKAYENLQKFGITSPEGKMTVQKILRSPDPGGELMQWHTNREILREVGNDPAAYRQRILDEARKDPEFRKQLFAEARAGANGNASSQGNGSQQPQTQPRTITRLPSLNGRPGGPATTPNARDYDTSDRGLFESAWAD